MAVSTWRKSVMAQSRRNTLIISDKNIYGEVEIQMERIDFTKILVSDLVGYGRLTDWGCNCQE